MIFVDRIINGDNRRPEDGLKVLTDNANVNSTTLGFIFGELPRTITGITYVLSLFVSELTEIGSYDGFIDGSKDGPII